MNLSFISAFLMVLSVCNGYKVLVLGPFNGNSHTFYMQSFVKALLSRGHLVSYLTSSSLEHLKLENYTELLIDPPFDLISKVPFDDLLTPDGSPFKTIADLNKFPKQWNAHNWESATVQQLIHATDLHFDVILNEEIFGDSFLMFAHKFNAPIVTVCTFGHTDYMDRQMGLLTPFSVTPHWLLPNTDEMAFHQRWFSTFVCIYDWIVRTYGYLPNEQELINKHFSHLAPLPSIDDLIRNVSLVLVNTQKNIFSSRPMMPNIVAIGGAHIQPPKSLPNDIQTFLDDSKHGVIYFAIGSALQSSLLSKDVIQAFSGTFRALKQRVIWKFEDESLPDIPPNVMIKKWLPQNDILNHPNVILFISHGGIFSMTESLYAGVPMLLIPFFTDQHRNAHLVASKGCGRVLPVGEITRDFIMNRIMEIISNESFMRNAKGISAIVKDSPVHPMDEAIWWIEHVAKFRGLRHLKSHAVHMHWFTYLLLDVIIVNFVAVLATLFTLYYLIWKCFSKNTKPRNSIEKKNGFSLNNTTARAR